MLHVALAQQILRTRKNKSNHPLLKNEWGLAATSIGMFLENTRKFAA